MIFVEDVMNANSTASGTTHLVVRSFIFKDLPVSSFWCSNAHDAVAVNVAHSDELRSNFIVAECSSVHTLASDSCHRNTSECYTKQSQSIGLWCWYGRSFG